MNEKLEEKLIVEVKKNPSILKKITNQTEAICLAAVKRDGYAIQFVDDQTLELCIEAVKENVYALQCIKNQREEICLAVLKQDAYNAVGFINDKLKTIYIIEAIKDSRCLRLKYIKDQVEKMPELVKYNGLALKFINYQTEELCLEAVKENVLALNYVKNKTNKIYKEALNYNFKDSSRLIPIKEKSTAMIVLEASLRNNKDRVILTKILNKFSKDQEIVDFYTKHKLWKHVDFNKLKNHKLFQYGMSL